MIQTIRKIGNSSWFPTHVDCQFANQDGQITLDQLRAVDKATQLVKKVGNLDNFTCEQVWEILKEMLKYEGFYQYLKGKVDKFEL